MAAILGIGDGILNTQISALLALLFKHDTVNILKHCYYYSHSPKNMTILYNALSLVFVLVETGRSICSAKSMAERSNSDSVLPKPLHITASNAHSDACYGLFFSPLFPVFSS